MRAKTSRISSVRSPEHDHPPILDSKARSAAKTIVEGRFNQCADCYEDADDAICHTGCLAGFGMRYRPDVWPPKRIAQFKKLWADDSLTQEQIAKKIGFDDAGSVGRKARALQLPARTPHWTEAEVARLKRLWEKTRSPSLIAERLGCSISSVNGQIRRLDLPTIEHTKWTPARDKLLKRLCIADPQLSSQQLALQLGCTPSAANAQRRRLDLPRPKPGRRA